MNNQEITQNTQEWLNWRAGKIGASDIPIIMGLSPYCTPLTLWKRMCGFEEPQKENSAMQKGKEMEPVIRDHINLMMETSFVPACMTHKELPWAIASLDGVDKKLGKIIEIKCNSKERHELARSGKVSDDHYAQLQWQLFVSDYDMVMYVSYNKDEELIVEVKRDDNYMMSKLLPAATEFLRRVMDFDAPPEMEKDKGYVHIDHPGFEVLAEEWKIVNRQIKQLEDREKELRKYMIEFTDDGDCEGAGVKLTRVKREGSVDWKKLYETIVKDYAEILLNEKYDKERYKKEEIGYWKIEEKK